MSPENTKPENATPEPQKAAAVSVPSTGQIMAEAGEVAAPEHHPLLEVVDVRHGMFGVSGTGDTSGYGGLLTTVHMTAPSQRPYGGWFDEVVDILTEVLDEGPGYDAAVEYVAVEHGELTLHVVPEHLIAVCSALRDDPDLRFELSLGVSGVHYPHDTGRELHVVFPLVSVTHGHQLRLEVAVSEDDPHLPSTVPLYPANDWHERETFDLYGIVFDGHPGLARILMPDDWVGHPLRKDYPLAGIPVEFKGATVPPVDERRAYR
jgi:NADH-quinone oxidoreductase subunit C